MTVLPTSHPQFTQLLARYERIIEISQHLTSTHDHKALLAQIIHAAMELIDTEAASILLIDPSTGELRFELASNLNAAEIETIVVPMEGSIAGWVVTHGEPRVIQDVRQEPSFFPLVDDRVEFTTRNLLAVPLRVQQKVIGTLEAVNKRHGQPFDSADIQLLTTLAGQAASAIENMRLFQQSDFMAEMVHELRTPLAALRTSIFLIQRPDLAEGQRTEIVATMRSEIERLITMTNDFLDLARLESGRIRLETAPIALDALIAECVTIVMPQADAQAIAVHTLSSGVVVTADRNKIKQVLLNLLTNAIKYNRPHGQIRVEVTRLERDGAAWAQTTVHDTGFGIGREAQKSMFQKFYRVSENATQVQGTGLGLAIAKHIIEAHRGTIGLSSEIGIGSSFWFTLPAVVE
jgi:signal transduction histidine kinase